MDSNQMLIKALDSRIQELEGRAQVLKDQKASLLDAIVSHALNSAPSCDRVCCGNKPRKYAYSTQECGKSPISSCVFNNTMDPTHKECLFCKAVEVK
jgi:hypothetical protein